MDNRYHLQALRHLYVLACVSRSLECVDVDTHRLVFAPIQVVATPFYPPNGPPQVLNLTSPCLLPPIPSIRSIKILGPRHWERTLYPNRYKLHRKILMLRNTVYVKGRAGYLSYQTDPLGLHSPATLFAYSIPCPSLSAHALVLPHNPSSSKKIFSLSSPHLLPLRTTPPYFSVIISTSSNHKPLLIRPHRFLRICVALSSTLVLLVPPAHPLSSLSQIFAEDHFALLRIYLDMLRTFAMLRSAASSRERLRQWQDALLFFQQYRLFSAYQCHHYVQGRNSSLHPAFVQSFDIALRRTLLSLIEKIVSPGYFSLDSASMTKLSDRADQTLVLQLYLLFHDLPPLQHIKDAIRGIETSSDLHPAALSLRFLSKFSEHPVLSRLPPKKLNETARLMMSIMVK